jgi:hypothetical protein
MLPVRFEGGEGLGGECFHVGVVCVLAGLLEKRDVRLVVFKADFLDEFLVEVLGLRKLVQLLLLGGRRARRQRRPLPGRQGFKLVVCRAVVLDQHATERFDAFRLTLALGQLAGFNFEHSAAGRLGEELLVFLACFRDGGRRHGKYGCREGSNGDCFHLSVLKWMIETDSMNAPGHASSSTAYVRCSPGPT